MDYIENEIKVLDVDVENLVSLLDKMGAKKVFDGERVITSFDNNKKTLQDKGIDIRITEEGRTKLSLDRKIGDKNSSIKLQISRRQEMTDFLAVLDIVPVAKMKSYRISYELDGIDFDIDQFEGIPPFLEIDMGDSGKDIEDIYEQLELTDKEKVTMSTKDIFKKYGKDYFEY